ncbi:leucyl/phenylalanyl-tRNA--protein transferase [Agilicoccus flavus]|uniref:leucyl/phenylalanyl-tRNA--protein transferase n=1 Tax=Agilicoccus flavus TaxID=2775968 RepID=UPI001CF6F3E6|nr:leucyl/phenylalanyl-tRNA--protein transferase [Agilicoccus flavus]
MSDTPTSDRPTSDTPTPDTPTGSRFALDPVEPPPSRWQFAVPASTGGPDLVAVGGDLAPGTVLAAYRAGLFPMGTGPGGRPPTGWWSPDPRGVLVPGELRVSRSLRRAVRRFDVTVDESFSEVVTACADPGRDGAWITREIHDAYVELHRLGWAHSVEVRDPAGDLVGGLYGLALGGLFAGESMFHRVTDASKVALVALCRIVADDGDPARLVDVQWLTDHLASLGAREIPRSEYVRAVRRATPLVSPAGFARRAPVDDPGAGPAGPTGERRGTPLR